MSATHRALACVAVKSRSTRSGAARSPPARTVVRTSRDGAALSINPAGAIPCCFSLERGAPFPSRDSAESPHSGDSTRPNSLPSTFGTLLPRIAGRTGSGLPRGIARNGQLDGSRERVAELSESLRSYALLSSSLVLSSPSPGVRERSLSQLQMEIPELGAAPGTRRQCLSYNARISPESIFDLAHDRPASSAFAALSNGSSVLQ